MPQCLGGSNIRRPPAALASLRGSSQLAAGLTLAVGAAFACSGGGTMALEFVHWPSGQIRLTGTGLIELQEMTEPRIVTKVLVPLAPEVASWWSSADEALNVKLVPCLAGEPHVHLEVWGSSPFEFNRRKVDGVRTVIFLPYDTLIQDCRVDWVYVTAEFPPLNSLGLIRALHVACPLSADRTLGGATGHSILSGLFFKVIFTWLLLPWPVLLMPLALWSMARPAVAASCACLARCAHRARRKRRVWRLRALTRRARHIAGAFGQGEPCCICLGETSQEGMIALLPCKHALHDFCYRGWICTDTYPSRELICPLCRCRAEAVGKLGP